MLYSLQEVIKFDHTKAKDFFIKSYKKYNHLGENIKFELVKVDLDKIIQEDTAEKNEGREFAHTQLELQNISNDLSNGVKPWEDLPVIVKINDPDVDPKFKYKLVAGFGTLSGLKTNGMSEYWFYEVSNATPSQIDEISSFENTSHIADTKYNTGEAGIVYHIKNQIAKKHKSLINTEDSILAYIDRVWPGMAAEPKGRILQKARNLQTKNRKFKEYGLPEIDNWLNETADDSAKFVFKGNFDKDRKAYGFAAKNVLDPIINAMKKYNETGKRSYVVLSVKRPGKTQSLTQMRKNKVNEFNKLLNEFKQLGVKNTNFISILGFMPQDKEVDQDMRFLVDVNGKSIKNENKKAA